MSELNELVQFILDPRIKVVSAALDLLLGLTATDEGTQQLLSILTPLSRNLSARYLSNDVLDEKILSILVNVSGAELDKERTTSVVQLVCKGIPKKPRHVELLSMLLANITTNEDGCATLCSGERSNFLASLLLKLLVEPSDPAQTQDSDPANGAESAELDPFRHLASVLTNVTRIPEGRDLVLRRIPDSPAPVFSLISRQLTVQIHAEAAKATEGAEPEAPLRRIGAAGAFKNLLMASETSDPWILDLFVSDLETLKGLLKPVSGGTPPSEPDASVRQAVAEALFFLARSEKGRDALWECSGPDAVRRGYEFEEHSGVCQAMERFASEILEHSQVDGAIPAPPSATAAGNNCSSAA